MSTAPTTEHPAVPRDVRRATRDAQEPIIGGVAAGLARHLAVPVLWVRAAFVLTALLGGLGVALYAGLWLVLPSDSRFETEAPGLESASRGGLRPGRIRRLGDMGPAIALAALAFGGVLVIEAVFGRGALFWPLFIGVVGIALLWRQADEAQRERWLDTTGRIDPVRVVLGNGGWAAYGRLAAGIGLVVTALVLFAFRGGSLSVARDVGVAAVLGVVGIAIVVGPWVYRLASDLTAERAERVRTQERADVAAHLHDSVLQTLALIQKNADDGPTVARLARSQERDLRSWLYSGESTDESTLASALRGATAAVEDAHGVSVDLVTVGDCDFDESLRAIVAATREAVTNAAKHAGAGRVDVYAEVSPSAVDVFVRDRGRGFDPEATRRTGTAYATASSTGWTGTADRPRCGRRSARGPRCACTFPASPAGPDRRTLMSEHAPVSVVIVDDHAMFRRGVRAELEATGAGVVTIRADAADDVIGTIRGGARGYVTKTITGPELVQAIRRVSEGDAVFSPRLAGFVLDAFSGSIDVAAVDEDLDRLTEREREVMRLIARGYAYKEVAKELFISIKTVETHMSSVLRKLQLSSRHELTRWASDRRLL